MSTPSDAAAPVIWIGLGLGLGLGCRAPPRDAAASVDTKHDMAWVPAQNKRLVGRGWPKLRAA
eukprot:scaffold98775_cov27-Phaeocystis_antarctica.AAC.1